MSIRNEKEVIAGCCRNDRRSQEQLYRQLLPTLMGMCMRYTKDRNDAMSIVNQGMLRVFKKIHTFEGKGSFEGWAKKLVFRTLADHYRKENRRVKLAFLDSTHDSPTHNHLQRLYAQDILLLVDELPPATKQVFCLYAIDGYTHKEIGAKLGISDGTSKWHLSQARKTLKKLIRKNFGQQAYAG